MFVILTTTMIISSINALDNFQGTRDECSREIVCGGKVIEISDSECEQWDFLYCIRTLIPRSHIEVHNSLPTFLRWKPIGEWRTLLSSVPLETPCLAVNEQSMTLICRGNCHDSRIEMDIRTCELKYLKNLPQNTGQQDSRIEMDIRTCEHIYLKNLPQKTEQHNYVPLLIYAIFPVILILFFVLSAMYFAITRKNSAEFERLHRALRSNTAPPPVPSPISPIFQIDKRREYLGDPKMDESKIELMRSSQTLQMNEMSTTL